MKDIPETAPSLVAKEILEYGKKIGPDSNGLKGFFEYRLNDWKMIYNPTTKEIHHIQPRSYR